jgi:hypothetical protein
MWLKGIVSVSKDMTLNSNASATKINKKKWGKHVSVAQGLYPSLTLGLICPVKQIVLAPPKFHTVSHACVVSHLDLFWKGKIVNLG